MIKHKTSEVNEKIKNYILECTKNEESGTTETELIAYLKKRFNSEYGYMVKRIGFVPSLKEWHRGLALNVDYMTSDCVNHVFEWLEYTEEEKENADYSALDDKYWHLLALHTSYLVK